MAEAAHDIPAAIDRLLNAVAAGLEELAEFDNIERGPHYIEAHAAAAPPAARYRLAFEDGRLWVAWVSADRYLSQSIEQVLVFTGDDLDDMIDEELVDLGWRQGRLGGNQHFRDEKMLFTFRSGIPLDADEITGDAAAECCKCIEAYRLAFADLGDMGGGTGED